MSSPVRKVFCQCSWSPYVAFLKHFFAKPFGMIDKRPTFTRQVLVRQLRRSKPPGVRPEPTAMSRPSSVDTKAVFTVADLR